MGRAIASAQKQTLDDIEILVIDDKSTDDTLAIAHRIAESDPRIRVLPQAQNGGPSAARNRGLKEARGKWIAVLDDDDRFHPERLQTLLAEAEARNADVIFDNIELFDAHSQTVLGIGIPPSFLGSGFMGVSDFLRACDPFLPGTKFSNLKWVIKKSIIADRDLSYSEAYRFGEDLKLYLEVFLTGATVYYVEKAFYTYTLQVGKQGQKSPFTRTVQDSSQLIGAMNDTLSKWQDDITPLNRSLIKRRLDALHDFQGYAALKGQIRERRPLGSVRSLIQNPRLFLRLANSAMSKFKRQPAPG